MPLLAPCLLAALVVGQTVADGRALVVDARVAGVAAAAVALALRAPLLVVLGAAAGVRLAARWARLELRLRRRVRRGCISASPALTGECRASHGPPRASR